MDSSTNTCGDIATSLKRHGPDYALLGDRGGNGRKVTACADRIREIVDLAPALTPAQIARLRGILGGALARLDEGDAA